MAAVEIVITQWALNAYLDLKHSGAFTANEYKSVIRPDVLLLKTYPASPKFQNSKFWSNATDQGKNRIPDGFKMKWHNIGNGKMQLRLPMGMFSEAVLCEAYLKTNPQVEKRQLARFKVHLDLVRRGRFTECGRLS